MLRASNFQDFLKSPIGKSKNFTWAEALYLSKWQIHVMPTHNDVFSAIELTAERMQKIRDLFMAPIQITSWFRPLAYNEEIGGSKRSSHLFGMACDFNVQGHDADKIREILRPNLEAYDMRMENLEGSNWVHIDINCTKNFPLEKRYFKP